MGWLLRIERGLDRALEAVITLQFFVIVVLTVLLVILRYGFNSSIIWGSEATNYLFIYTTALGAAVSVSRGTHIRISCLVELAGEGRARRALEAASCAVVGVVNAVLCVYSLPWIRSTGGFESPVMRLPMWVVQSAVPVGCGLAALFAALRAARILSGVSGPAGGERC